MACVQCGLDNQTCEEWGYPRLVTTETEWVYCDCDYCEGHEGATNSLAPEDWYWKPQRHMVDMSDLFKLENEPSLFTEIGRLGGQE